MRKALLPMVASLALCGAATGSLIATKARAAQSQPRKPMMVALVTPQSGLMTAAPRAEGGAPPMMGRAPQCSDIYADRVGEMAYLETRFGLTAAQAPLFARWKAVALDIARRNQADCTAHQQADRRPGMLEGLAEEETMLKHRLADLQAERPALEAFYRSLNPTQRAEFERGGQEAPPPRR